MTGPSQYNVLTFGSVVSIFSLFYINCIFYHVYQLNFSTILIIITLILYHPRPLSSSSFLILILLSSSSFIILVLSHPHPLSSLSFIILILYHPHPLSSSSFNILILYHPLSSFIILERPPEIYSLSNNFAPKIKIPP